jgi:hypothetical protein
MHSNWHNQGGSKQITKLNSCMVVAVPEGWQLHDAGIVRPSGTEHLREDGMGNWYIQALSAEIRDTESYIVHSGKVVVEGLE